MLLFFQVGAGLLAKGGDLAPGGEGGVGIGVAPEAPPTAFFRMMGGCVAIAW